MLIYINFNFDFLGLDKVYFKNYFANELDHIMARNPIQYGGKACVQSANQCDQIFCKAITK